MRSACVVIRLPMFSPWQRAAWAGFLAVALSLLGTGRLAAEDWPQFRGPNCTGVSTSKKRLPLEFSATKNVRWSAELGDGIGSPVVADGRVFSTAMAGDRPGGDVPLP
jgi:hypothetical protein